MTKNGEESRDSWLEPREHRLMQEKNFNKVNISPLCPKYSSLSNSSTLL